MITKSNTSVCAFTQRICSINVLNLSKDFKTPAGDNFGAHSFVIDVKNTATLYLGTSAQGIFKTADCGATWVHVNTGRNGDKLDSGRQWTFLVDPIDPDVLYTNSGYSQNNVWRSMNGGVDWDPLVPEDYLKVMQFGGFVHLIAMDPTNHQHLIVSPHFACEVGAFNGLPKTSSCILETTDAGVTWKILEGTPGGVEGGGPWMDDSNTWYWSRSSEGLWRTANAGLSWEHVYAGGYASIGDVKLSNGKRYCGGVFSMLESSDGGASWTTIPNSPGAQFVAGDGDRLFSARDIYFNTASVNDPSTWTSLPSLPVPKETNTWDIKYDPDHHILYSVDNTAGFWRMVIE